MAYPTLFVGVGGMGANLVRKIRQKILAEYSPNDPELGLFKFIILDPVCDLPPGTDTDPSDGFPRKDWLTLSGYTNEDYQKMATASTKYGDLKKRQYAGYVVAPDAVDGYNQVRYNGAVGLKMSCEQTHLVNRLGRAIADLNAYHGKIPKGNDKLLTFVCSSMSGGTGSGVTLDLGYLLNGMLASSPFNPSTIAVLAQPELMSGFVADVVAENFYANSYSFMRELNWYMMAPSKKHSDQKRNFLYENKFGHVKVKEKYNTPWGPFHQAFMISTLSEQGRWLPSHETAIATAAESIYLMLRTNSTQYFVNGSPKDVEENKFGEKRPIMFGGLGSYTLHFPSEQVRDYLMARAASTLLGDYVVSPAEGVNTRGDQCYARFTKDKKLPLLIDGVSQYVRTHRGHPVFDYTKVINSITPQKKPLHKFLSTVYNDIKPAVDAKGGIRAKMQDVLAHLQTDLMDKIDDTYKNLLREEGNMTAIGVAAVFLYNIQSYCEQKTGRDQIEADSDEYMRVKADKLEDEIRDAFLSRSPKTTAVEKKYGRGGALELLTRKIKAYRISVGAIAGELVGKILDQAMYEELDLFYRAIHAHVKALKRPIRFIQEEVAANLRKEYKHPESFLFVGDDKIGNIDLVCSTRQAVDTLVTSEISFLEEDGGVKAKDLKAILAEMMPDIEGLIGIVSETMSVFRGDEKQMDKLILKHEARFRGLLEDIIRNALGKKIMAELNANCSITQMMLKEEIAEGKTKTAAVDAVIARISRTMDNVEVFSGFDDGGSHTYKTKPITGVLLNMSKAEKVLSTASGKNINLKNLLPKHVRISKTKDFFSVSGMISNCGHPLFASQNLAECREAYYAANPEGLHTDSRFSEANRDAPDAYQLPPVEMIGDGDSADIYLFCIAEQDWLKEIDNPNEDSESEWAAPLHTPLIEKNNQDYYLIRSPAGNINPRGRESAQQRFMQNEDVSNAVREQIGDRWNLRLDEAKKKSLLTTLLEKKVKELGKTKFNELKHCYAREIEILEAALATSNFNI